MSHWLLALAASTVRDWVRMYSFGLPPEIRARRHAEIESDLWEQQADRAQSKSGPGKVGLRMLGRLILGAADDLSWRTTQSVHPEASKPGFARTAVIMAVLILALGLGTLLGRDDAYGVSRAMGLIPISVAAILLGSLGLRSRYPLFGGALALVTVLAAAAIAAWSLVAPLLGVIAAYYWVIGRDRSKRGGT